MTNYESLRVLFQFFKMKFVSQKHWTKGSGWGMGKVMHKVFLEAIKATFAVTSIITVSVNEVIAIDNTQWLSIHLYVVEQWRRIPILLCVEIVDMSTTSENIFALC
jgi:hypothetical protein